MDNWTRLNVLALIFLSTSLVLVGIQTHAISAPSIGNRQDPGSATDPCRFTAYLDGSTYLVKDGQEGGNAYSGTASILQTAIDALPAGGGKFCFTGGTFTIPLVRYTRNAVNYDIGLNLKDNVTLRGAGLGKTIITIANSASAVGTSMAVISHSRWGLGGSQESYAITIEDLTVDGNKANNGNPNANIFHAGIILSAVRNFRITNVEAKNADSWGIGTYTADSNGVNGIIENVRALGNGNGITANFDSGIFISYQRKHGTKIIDSFSYSNDGYGIVLEDSPDYITIQNVEVYFNVNSGIFGTYGITGTGHLQILGSKIHSNQDHGILLQPVGNDTIVSGNSVFLNDNSGIVVRAETRGVKGVNVINNIVYNNGQDAGVDREGIGFGGSTGPVANVTGGILMGNISFDSQTTKTQDWGYADNANLSNILLIGNDFSGNRLTSVITTARYAVIANNYNP